MTKVILFSIFTLCAASAQVIPGSAAFYGTPGATGNPFNCRVGPYSTASYGAYAWCYGTASCNPMTANILRGLPGGRGSSLFVSASAQTFCNVPVTLSANGQPGLYAINAYARLQLIGPLAVGTTFNQNDDCRNEGPVSDVPRILPCPGTGNMF